MAKNSDHPNRARLRGHGYFKRLGPGLVTGAADDDPSGIGTYSQVGASLRFDLLWTTVVSLPMAAAVLEVAARLGLTTGRGLAALVRERFPRPVLYLVVFLVVAANTFNIGADLGSMAASLRLLVPVPHVVGIVGMAVVMTVLQITVPYQRYARVLRWLVLSLVAYVGVLAAVKVPWGEVLRNTFLPSLTGDKAHLEALIAIFGTTISPYLFFWQAAEEVEEGQQADKGGESHAGDRSSGDDEVTVDQLRRIRSRRVRDVCDPRLGGGDTRCARCRRHPDSRPGRAGAGTDRGAVCGTSLHCRDDRAARVVPPRVN